MAIRMERADMVATIVIDRPEARNAVDGPAARALVEAFSEFERDDALRVAVLWGAGSVFCAGADLKARGGERGLRLEPDGDGPMGPSRMAFTKPTIAAVEGYAVAGGLELALMCDLRVASETAVFGVFCRRWGVPLIDGGTVRLPRLIDLITEALAAERATLFLHDPDTGELFSRVTDGGSRVAEIRVRMGAGIAGAVFQTGRAEIIGDAYADPRFHRDIDLQTGFHTRSVLAAPIRNRADRIIGVTQVLNKRAGDFTAADLALLEAVHYSGVRDIAVTDLAQARDEVQRRLELQLFTPGEAAWAEALLAYLDGQNVDVEAARAAALEEWPRVAAQIGGRPPAGEELAAYVDGLDAEVFDALRREHYFDGVLRFLVSRGEVAAGTVPSEQ